MSVEVGDLYLALTAPGAPEAVKDLKKVDDAAKAAGKSFEQSMVKAEKATQKTTAQVTKLTDAERAHLKAVMASHEATMRARAEESRALIRAEAERERAARKAHADSMQSVRDAQERERAAARAANAARRAGAPINQGVDAARAAAAARPAASGNAFDAVGLGAQANATRAALDGANASGAAAGATRTLAGSFAAIAPLALGYAFAIGGLVNRLLAYAKVADEARASTNRLRGAAIDSGESFAVMKQRADAARVAYNLTHEEATQLITATSRLEAETNGAARSQDVLAAAMKTARARGLSNAEAVGLIESAIKGNAEAIRELTGMKPDELYAKWAAKSGVTADALNDVGKQQALANGMIEEGARRATDAASAVDELTAAQLRQASAQNELRVAIGNALTPMRTWFAEVTADALQNLLALRRWAEGVDAAIARIGKNVPTAGAPAGKPINPVSVSPLLQFVGGTSFDAFKPKKVKEEKDTTDQLISSLVTLFGARKADASQIARTLALYDREKKILDDTTQSLERRAKAYERTQQLEKAGVITPGKIIPMPEGKPQLDSTFIDVQLPQVDVENEVATFDDAYTAYVGMIAGIVSQGEFSRVVGKAFKDQTSLAFQGVLQADLQAIASDFTLLTRDFAGVLIDGIASGFSKGWGSAKDIILSGLGSILQAMGKHLMVTGAALKGLLPFLTNPFTSGGAMIAAGALIYGAGVTLSAIAAKGSGGGSAGGFAGGSVGGLGIGGSASQPQSYSLAAGNRYGVIGASGSASDTKSIVVQFNGPIIGPNDVQAQSAIAAVVNNAARRGLIR